MQPMDPSAPPQANPHRFNAERKPHQVVSLSFKENVNDPTPLEALEETSQPENLPNCLRWGTRDGLARGNQRLLCEVSKDKPTLPFPGFSFQAIAKADLWHSLNAGEVHVVQNGEVILGEAGPGPCSESFHKLVSV